MRSLLAITLCGLTALGGFFVGRQTHRSEVAGLDSALEGSSDKTTPTRQRSDKLTTPAAGEFSGIMSGAQPGKPQAALAASMKAALSTNIEATRLTKWMKLLSVMRPEDAPLIAEFLKAEDAAGRDHAMESTTFWQTWAALDVRGAWAYARENTTSAPGSGAGTVMKAWAMTDPRGAGDMVLSMEDSPQAKQAQESLLHGLAESNPAEAVDFVTNRLPANLQEIAAVHIGGSLISQLGNQDTQTWFDQLPANVPPVFQKEAARVLIESLSRSSPEEVEKFALARLDQPWAANQPEQLFTAMMISRGGGSPWNYLSATIEKFPNAGTPFETSQQIAYRQSPPALVEWANSHPDAPDALLGGIAVSLMNRGNIAEGESLQARIKDTAIAEKITAARVISVGGLRREKN